ncbi:four-carbon acid sugar kinase family protein [Paenibacillaceae bacterium WGS1546]|uniref:four-carbon acid sugar kinase family protein n=1 Tax=Cohnella sp. WGS1546 TaxID=3366810 RepID=UPI00372D2E96
MIGVVADDITGANDIGVMFAKFGLLTHVYAYEAFSAERLKDSGERPDVVVLDTNSRLDSGDTAYRKVAEATGKLREAGVRQWVNKTCSVFRGNVGREFDAMLDTLQAGFAVVVLGFPKNGRTTVDGIHYVRGKLLEASEFRDDPVHPMKQSDLAAILRGQTRRRIANLRYPAIEQGPEALRERIAAMRGVCEYLILDVRSQADLAAIAEAVQDEAVLCGSSGLAEELAARMAASGRARGTPAPLRVPQKPGVGMLCAAGSLMPQTAAQIDDLKRRGVPAFELDSLAVLDEKERTATLDWLSNAASERMLNGENVLVHTSNRTERVEETKRIGLRAGMTAEEVSRAVSAAVAEAATRITERTGQPRLVVAGGETSAAVCGRMGIRGMRVWKEIEPGLPSCVSLGSRPKLLVLKSGSFGKPDFFAAAFAHLQQQ